MTDLPAGGDGPGNDGQGPAGLSGSGIIVPRRHASPRPPTTPVEARPQPPAAPALRRNRPNPKTRDLRLRPPRSSRGKYEDAIQRFQGFHEKYPKSERADNALFWVGRIDFALKQYEQAILAFNDVIKNYPKETRCRARC